MIPFIRSSKLEKTNLWRQKSEQWLSLDRGYFECRLERSMKEFSRVLVTVLLHLGGSYTGVFTL